MVLDADAGFDAEVNASGHPDQLKRQYGLLRVAGAAITIDNAWVVLGSSISVSICVFFQSPPHLIYHRD